MVDVDVVVVVLYLVKSPGLGSLRDKEQLAGPLIQPHNEDPIRQTEV